MKQIFFTLLFGALPLLAADPAGWQSLANNQFDQAREQFATDMERDTLAEIGWFLTFTGNGPTRELRDAGLTVLRRDPNSGASEFVLKWFESFRECINDWSDQIQIIYQGQTITNPEILVYVSNCLRETNRQSEGPPEFERIARDAGFFVDYKISERFGAYPIPAFERAWPAEKAAYWAAATVERSRTGVVIPPRRAQGKGVYYALSSFDNPVDQTVRMRFYTFQNATIYVDGKIWGAVKMLETLGPNVSTFEGRLAAGTHEVVVKTTQTSANNGQFSLQVTAAQAPRILVPESARFDLGSKRHQAERVDTGLMAELRDRNGELADLVRAYLLLRAKDDEQALESLEPLAALHGESMLIGGALARLYLSSLDFLPQDMQFARAYQYLSKVAMAGRDHNLENLLTLSLLLNKAQQKQPALELLEAVIEANPAFCDGLEARMLFAEQDGLTDVKRKTLALLEALGPQHVWALSRQLDEARGVGDITRSRQLLTELAQLRPWEGYRAQLLEMDENYQGVIEDLVKRWEVFDDRDFYPFAISRAYAKLGDRAAQRQWLERTLEVNPTSREAMLDIVNLDCLEGKEDQASARLTEYLQIAPADAFFRQRLSHLEGRTAFEEFRVDTAKIIEEAKQKPFSEGADSELLLDQLMVRLFPDGSQMRYTHLITRVLTKKGVDEEGELNLNENLEILELRTIKADGSVFYPADIDNKTSISLSGIGIGDFIDEEHIEYLGPAYYDADGLDAEMTFIFQGLDRIYHHSELVLIYPEGLQPEPIPVSTRMPVEPQVMSRDGLKIVRWLTEDMPPMTVEPAMPARAFSQPTASFYYNTTWQEIHDFYYDAARDRMGLTEKVKREAASWRAQAKDDLELAKLAYEKVTDHLERDGTFFRNVNLSWETRQGNATLLLANIYEELGLKSAIVFVQPKEMEHYGMDVPQPVYSYALLRIEIAGKTYWADPNQKGIPFNYIPIAYRGARGMVLSLDELFTTLPEGDPCDERIEKRYNLFFRGDGSAVGMTSDRFHGLVAGQLKEGYKALNRPEIKQRIEAAINQDYPGAVVDEVTMADDLPRGQFELRTDFHHKTLAQTQADGLSVSFPLKKTPLLEAFGSLPSRKTPVMVRTPQCDTNTLALNIPEGYRWNVKPFNIMEKSQYGTYELSLTVKSERDLVLERRVFLDTTVVPPSDYPKFLAFLKAMASHEDLSLKATKTK